MYIVYQSLYVGRNFIQKRLLYTKNHQMYRKYFYHRYIQSYDELPIYTYIGYTICIYTSLNNMSDKVQTFKTHNQNSRLFDFNKLLNVFRTPPCSVSQHLIGESVQGRVNLKIIKRGICYCQALYFLDCLLIYDRISTINYFSMK